ncbi:MAG: right-handed parallel beta-helix repeat-containing protein [Phycisphaerales bacterium]
MIPLPRKYGPFCISGFLLIPVLLFSAPANSAIIYVDGTVGPCGDGVEWDTAYRYLQDALLDADSGDEIWVARGTYYVDRDCGNPLGVCNDPRDLTEREATFQLKDDVDLYGGFLGTETARSQRDPAANLTILSGILGECPSSRDPDCPGTGDCFDPDGNGTPGCKNSRCCQIVCNMDPICCLGIGSWDELCAATARDLCGEAYHVVRADGDITSETVIDGFTIRDGVANGDLDDDDFGGGMIVYGEPNIVRCTFTYNMAENKGGGMYISGVSQSPELINCIFQDNPGAMSFLETPDGGALANFNAAPNLVNCLFSKNIVWNNGGAIHNETGVCLAGGCGEMTIVNCTFADNQADSDDNMFGTGGAIYIGGTVASIDADSCIFWGNTPDQIDNPAGGPTSVQYSDVQGGFGTFADMNLNVDPLFVNPPLCDYHLKRLSPVIDKGNPDISVIPCDEFDLDNDGILCGGGAFFLGEPTPDLDLRNRVLNGDSTPGAIVDMGSYERGPAVVPIGVK